jgi:hypothetical protein
MKATIPILLLTLAVTSSLRGQRPKGPISAQGTVIAVQGRAAEAKLEEPGSVASAIEMWIVHIDHWPTEYKPGPDNTVLVEYRFARRNEAVSEKELDQNAWNFELWEAVGEDRKSCLAWITPDQRFRPTLMAKGRNTRSPSKLSCFLLKKRPAPVSSIPTTH